MQRALESVGHEVIAAEGGRELVLETPAGFRTLDEMLPQGFGPADLNAVD